MARPAVKPMVADDNSGGIEDGMPAWAWLLIAGLAVGGTTRLRAPDGLLMLARARSAGRWLVVVVIGVGLPGLVFGVRMTLPPTVAGLRYPAEVIRYAIPVVRLITIAAAIAAIGVGCCCCCWVSRAVLEIRSL
jgi:hypothetical protein